MSRIYMSRNFNVALALIAATVFGCTVRIVYLRVTASHSAPAAPDSMRETPSESPTVVAFDDLPPRIKKPLTNAIVKAIATAVEDDFFPQIGITVPEEIAIVREAILAIPQGQRAQIELWKPGRAFGTARAIPIGNPPDIHYVSIESPARHYFGTIYVSNTLDIDQKEKPRVLARYVDGRGWTIVVHDDSR